MPAAAKSDPNKKKRPKPGNLDLKYNWREDDATIPKGWRVTTVVNKIGGGRSVKSKRYLAPDGTFCYSRPFALRHMVKVAWPKEDIDLMERGLVKEGWVQGPHIPSGWYD